MLPLNFSFAFLTRNYTGFSLNCHPKNKKSGERKILTKVILRAIITERSGNARVVELADSLDSGSSAHSGRAGSSPASRTKTGRICFPPVFLCFWYLPSIIKAFSRFYTITQLSFS